MRTRIHSNSRHKLPGMARAGLILLGVMLISLPAWGQNDSEPDDPSSEPGSDSSAAPDSTMALDGDEEGTVLRSLTIEGEDRVHIEFERPVLKIELDARQVGGLSWGSPMEVVQRGEVDLRTPLLATSAAGRSPVLGRPWLRELRTGSVARFRPNLKSVSSWQLIVADSRGDTVRVFEGKGSPPQEIAWDGMYASGVLALPGLTYSYVLQALDKAGNRRNFIGQGFEIVPYRIATDDGYYVVISGKTLMGPTAAARPAGTDDPMLLEAVSWLNQLSSYTEPVQIRVTARSFEMADALGALVRDQLLHCLNGQLAR